MALRPRLAASLPFSRPASSYTDTKFIGQATAILERFFESACIGPFPRRLSGRPADQRG